MASKKKKGYAASASIAGGGAALNISGKGKSGKNIKAAREHYRAADTLAEGKKKSILGDKKWGHSKKATIPLGILEGKKAVKRKRTPLTERQHLDKAATHVAKGKAGVKMAKAGKVGVAAGAGVALGTAISSRRSNHKGIDYK